MKTAVAALAIGFGLITTTYAAHLDDVCETAYQRGERAREIVFAGTDLMARPDGYGAVIEHLDGTLVRRFEGPIKAIAVSGDTLWALGGFDLHELTLNGELKASYNFDTSGNPDWAATGMAVVDGMIVISRQFAGVMGFEIAGRSFKWHNVMGENEDGTPVAVAANGNKAYVAVTSNREDGFTGVATLDIHTGQTLLRTPYNRARSGVVGVDAVAQWHDGQFWLNNGGWMHVLTEQQLDSSRQARPRWRAHVVMENGPVTRHYMMLTGGFYFEGKELVGCGMYTTHEDNVIVRRSRLFRMAIQ